MGAWVYGLYGVEERPGGRGGVDGRVDECALCFASTTTYYARVQFPSHAIGYIPLPILVVCTYILRTQSRIVTVDGLVSCVVVLLLKPICTMYLPFPFHTPPNHQTMSRSNPCAIDH